MADVIYNDADSTLLVKHDNTKLIKQIEVLFDGDSVNLGDAQQVIVTSSNTSILTLKDPANISSMFANHALIDVKKTIQADGMVDFLADFEPVTDGEVTMSVQALGPKVAGGPNELLAKRDIKVTVKSNVAPPKPAPVVSIRVV